MIMLKCYKKCENNSIFVSQKVLFKKVGIQTRYCLFGLFVKNNVIF